jgi:hypothetical protein
LPGWPRFHRFAAKAGGTIVDPTEIILRDLYIAIDAQG